MARDYSHDNLGSASAIMGHPVVLWVKSAQQQISLG